MRLVLTRRTLFSSTSCGCDDRLCADDSFVGREFEERKTGGLPVCAFVRTTHKRQDRPINNARASLPDFGRALSSFLSQVGICMTRKERTNHANISARALFPFSFC